MQITSFRQTRIESLQVVRAIAFLGIFTSHSGVSELGAWGVSVFLVLSGFVMAYTYFDRELDVSVKQNMLFSINKVKRLYPLHILMMLVALILEMKELYINFSIKDVILCFGKLVSNIALLQTWVPSSKIYFSLNGVAWYLSVCLFIYAVFPPINRAIRSLNCKKTIVTAAAVYFGQIFVGIVSEIVGLNLLNYAEFSKWITYVLPIFRTGDFIIGCCIGNVFIKSKVLIQKYNGFLFTALEIGTVFLIFVSDYIYRSCINGCEWFRYSMLYTPTSIMLILLFALNKGGISKILTCKLLVYIGNMSNYTFLIHLMVIRYVRIITGKLFGETLNLWNVTIISLIVTFVCAEIYKKIENKICYEGVK